MRAVVYDEVRRDGAEDRKCRPDRYQHIAMTGRAFFTMLIFVGFVVGVMWFAVMPALTTYRPTLP